MLFQVLKEKADESRSRQTAMVETSQKELREKQEQMIAEMKVSEEENLKNFVKDQETAIQNEQTRQAMPPPAPHAILTQVTAGVAGY